MARRLRVLSWLALGSLAIWMGRLFAHSKVPPPEGRWREVILEELG